LGEVLESIKKVRECIEKNREYIGKVMKGIGRYRKVSGGRGESERYQEGNGNVRRSGMYRKVSEKAKSGE
jgi:hypothetical protein